MCLNGHYDLKINLKKNIQTFKDYCSDCLDNVTIFSIEENNI